MFDLFDYWQFMLQKCISIQGKYTIFSHNKTPFKQVPVGTNSGQDNAFRFFTVAHNWEEWF